MTESKNIGAISLRKLTMRLGDILMVLVTSSVAELLPVVIEKSYGNERIRKNRKSYWIEQYDSVSFGENKKS